MQLKKFHKQDVEIKVTSRQQIILRCLLFLLAHFVNLVDIQRKIKYNTTKTMENNDVFSHIRTAF